MCHEAQPLLAAQIRTSRRASLSVDVMNTPQTSHTVIVRSRSVALRCASSYSARVISTYNTVQILVYAK